METLQEYIDSTFNGVVPEVIDIDYKYIKMMSYDTIKAIVFKSLELSMLSRKPAISIVNCDLDSLRFEEVFQVPDRNVVKFDCVVKSVSSDYIHELETITYKCRRCGNELQSFNVEHGNINLPAGVSCTGCNNHKSDELEIIPDKTIFKDCKYVRLDSLDGKNSILGKFYRGMDNGIRPGNRLTVVASPDFIYQTRNGTKTQKYFHILGVENHDDEVHSIDISPEDIGAIVQASKSPRFLRDMLDSIFPYIAGMDGIKLALLLSSVGGVSSKTNRGESHTILIGDPGTGKSELVSSMLSVLPKCGRASGGSSTSGVGLTCACVPSIAGNGYDLIYGLLPLCNGGHAFIDEISRLKPEDRDAFHESLESGIISVHKGGFDVTLECHTTIFACANPIGNKFEGDVNPWIMTGVEPSLLSRFDHRIIVYNEQTRETNRLLGRMARNRRTNNAECIYTKEFISKYITYARRLTVTCEEYLIDYMSDCLFELGINTNRDAIGMQRIAESYARLNLHEKVEPIDVVKTVLLIRYERSPITIVRESKSLCIDSTTIIMLKEYVKVLLTKEPMTLVNISKMLEDVHGNDLVSTNDLLVEMVTEGSIKIENGVASLK